MEEAVRVFRVLGQEIRLRIFLVLLREELCVCELTELFDRSQPAISQHLKQLKDAELLRSRREEQWIFYRSNPRRLESLLETLGLSDNYPGSLTDQWAEKIDQIKSMNLCEIRDRSNSTEKEMEES